MPEGHHTSFYSYCLLPSVVIRTLKFSINNELNIRSAHVKRFVDGKCRNVLADLRTASRTIELKALSFNPVHPVYVAFACGDRYIRVLDRRYVRSNRSGMLVCG